MSLIPSVSRRLLALSRAVSSQAGRVAVDALEPRRMLAASAALSPDGTLLITGTDNADVIIFSLVPKEAGKLKVKLNRVATQFDLSAITNGVQVRALAGNDRITVGKRAAGLNLDFTVFAGAGNDKIILGAGNDTVDAGDGNDAVSAGAGDDLLLGAAGSDKLSGGAGHDCLHGGSGNDKLAGDAGEDELLGEDGNDALDGGAGGDRLMGGTGNDKLAGKAGDDDLFGDDGNDTLDGGADDDHLDGGDGLDKSKGGRGSDSFVADSLDTKGLADYSTEDAPAPGLDELPQTVKDAYASLFADRTPLKVATEDSAGNEVTDQYIFLVSVDGILHDLTLAPDGTVLFHEAGDSDTPLTLGDLPAASLQDFNTNFPGAQLLKLGAEDGAGDGIITEYQLGFLFDGRLHDVVYDTTGGRTSTESEDDGPLTPDRLPAAVTERLSGNYPGYTLLNLAGEDSAGDGRTDLYLVSLLSQDTLFKLTLTPSGEVISLESDADDSAEDSQQRLAGDGHNDIMLNDDRPGDTDGQSEQTSGDDVNDQLASA